MLNAPKDEYKIEREKVASDKKKKDEEIDGDIDATEETTKKRAMDRMDLWLEGKDNIIIIENKIKSGINGSRHDVNGELVQSQLSAYYNYAAKNKKGKKVHCFIFAPNYSEVDTEKGLYEHNDKYKVVRYRDIFNFFNNPAYIDLFKDDPFQAYPQFVAALSMHIYKPDEEMEKRFVTMIRDGDVSLKNNTNKIDLTQTIIEDLNVRFAKAIKKQKHKKWQFERQGADSPNVMLISKEEDLQDADNAIVSWAKANNINLVEINENNGILTKYRERATVDNFSQSYICVSKEIFELLNHPNTVLYFKRIDTIKDEIFRITLLKFMNNQTVTLGDENGYFAKNILFSVLTVADNSDKYIIRELIQDSKDGFAIKTL